MEGKRKKGLQLLKPVSQNQLIRQETGESCAIRWRATGADPHFSLAQAEADSVRLAAGWQYIAFELTEKVGELKHPRLYVDYGYGFSEDDSIDLSPLRTAHGFEGLVCMFHPVRGLRFDPSTEPCEFVLGSLVVRRLDKMRAFRHMAGRLRQKGSSRLAVASGFSTRLLFGGPRAAGGWLYECYVGASAKGNGDYTSWVERYDRLGATDHAAIKERIGKLAGQPLISLVLPVYNTPEKWLRRCLDTVISQLYPNWELCIADDASPRPHVRRVLEEYLRKDSRIKVVFREKNGHISQSSNSAIRIATGDYLALIDHDDELPEHALYMVVEAINAHPDAKLIYSDEDKIDENGVRFDPYFKPDWNPDLFRGHNMISHLGVYKTSLVRDLGGFRVGYEGSQDYDLALRVTEAVERHEVVHVPHVLYHWRAIAGSTALSPGEKSYAHIASRKALMAHLERIGLKGEFVEMPRFQGNWSFRAELEGRPQISIIIPTRDGLDYLSRCVNSIRAKSTYRNYEILIIDNQSSDADALAYMDAQAMHADTQVLRYDRPFNFSAINNFAAERASGELLLFLNNDTEVITPAWLEEMAAHAMRSNVGAVGAMLYYPDDTVQHAGIVLGLGAAGVAGHSYHLKPRGFPGQMCRMHLVQEVSAVTAACLMVRREVFRQVDGFDESFPVAFNDVDLCLRILYAGYVNVWTPRSELYHFESVTRGSDADAERKARFDRECDRFKDRWAAELVNDRYFNPNLRLDSAGFQFGATRASHPWQDTL
ncbi:glycosyltransferase family 2 protein [Rhodanobacter denitrificans]|uniref:glycosyltransferase family 2 protein n=1 Tax=Rhodanobacter denitrificans TaxID=666685 RepID=UPI000260D0AF|nr:glycosyltransferase family 2 protein [Rhodanobacter denitrificans]EIM02481.1 glycosyl transferase family protein [Rhodanobacter denitrificans]UJM90031.1 glycosyltransferase family 2 protein [Rhodanobacter denitrificans]